jgi:transcriptional regulator with XRE-family HTH domain
MEEETTFGQWVQRRRKALDLSKQDLARRANCSVWTLAKIEADSYRPSQSAARDLFAGLGLPSEECETLLRWARAAPGTPWRAVADAAAAGVGAPQRQTWRAPEATFIVGPPICHPRQFFGRAAEARRIFALWSRLPLQHVAITGPKRSGKTSLLRYLMAGPQAPAADLRADQRAAWLPHLPRHRWVFVDFRDPRMRQRERLLRHILAGLDLPAPEPCGLERFLDCLSDHLDRPTLIVMDDLGAALDAPELGLPFWESLRALANHHAGGLLGFVLAAHQDPALLAQERDQSSPFFNIFGHCFPLGPLTDDEARALIASAPEPFLPADVDWILDQSGRWPCLTQILCDARLALPRDRAGDTAWRHEGLRRLAPYCYLLEQR